jgi:sigma-B regulation protein RsbU (phosphoserine phosphatase)
MNKRYLSFSKRLSRRILVVFVLTTIIVTLFVATYASMVLWTMATGYFQSELQVANNLVAIQAKAPSFTPDWFYQNMRMLDKEYNTQNPLFPRDIKEQYTKGIWAYSIVIDGQGIYRYHPDKQRIGRDKFDGVLTGSKGDQYITIDGEPSYIFYRKVKDTDWTNAIIVPVRSLLIPSIIIGLIILAMIAVGLLIAYWVSRITIRHSTKPLRLLAESADKVAQGNFENPLPELKHHDEISQLRDSFGNMQQSLTQYIDQLKTTTAQKAAIESELNIAREIQLSMVPTVFPERDDLEIYASMTPAKAVGGDLYDFFVRNDQLYICIGDVSGKGVPAALFMAQTMSLFRAYSSDDSAPHRIVSQMNHVLGQNNENCMFVTFLVGILDLKSGELRYCNAGHEPPILINHEAELLSIENLFPVGISDDTPYQTQTTIIKPQTTILLYTDGLNEAMNAEEQLFGDERIIDELNRAIAVGQLAPKALIEGMTKAVHAFVGDTEQSDDLTMLCLRYNK